LKKENYFGNILTDGAYVHPLKLVFIFDGNILNVSFYFNGVLNWYQSVVYLSGREKIKNYYYSFAWSKALFYGVMLTLKPRGSMFCHL